MNHTNDGGIGRFPIAASKKKLWLNQRRKHCLSKIVISELELNLYPQKSKPIELQNSLIELN